MSMLKRKITDEIREWKNEYSGKKALFIEGARGVGKSTVVREFAKSNYDSCLIIDFSKKNEEVNKLFWDLYDPDAFYDQLQAIYSVKLVPRRSVIVLDEVQYFMRACECIIKFPFLCTIKNSFLLP